MRILPTLLTVLAVASTGLGAECRPSKETMKVRVDVKAQDGIALAGVVLSVDYPADRMVIAGQGTEAAKAAVTRIPEGAFTMSEDRDGELRMVVAKAKALTTDPLCEVTFHRCEGSGKAEPKDVTCHLTDASDAGTNKVDLEKVSCTIGEAS